MKQLILILAIIATSPVALGAEEAKASSLAIADPAFHDPEIRVLESAPTQFEIVLEREMPTPGWTFTVDAVETDEKTGRIVARVTENRPKGIVAQVITPGRLELRVGSLAKGRYVFEIWLRRGAATNHRPAHTLILSAR
jgi:hypothetical protein